MPGCASGEEVYSIAIALVEYLGERLVPGRHSDLRHRRERGGDREGAGRGLPRHHRAGRLERAPRSASSSSRTITIAIAKGIRDLCIFARQDVTRDPPFSRLDLVSCRNLLIYLDAAAQRRVMQVFHYALRPQGFLMLGPSESVGQASDLFETRRQAASALHAQAACRPVRPRISRSRRVAPGYARLAEPSTATPSRPDRGGFGTARGGSAAAGALCAGEPPG